MFEEGVYGRSVAPAGRGLDGGAPDNSPVP